MLRMDEVSAEVKAITTANLTDAFAPMITRLRVSNGWSQQELANKCGVTQKAISDWERGRSLPIVCSLARLSHVFHISMNTLLGSPEYPLA